MNEKQNDAMADFWLHTATSALCDEARVRIAVEIKAHYADLVELHLAEGMPLVDARLKALEDLGDAHIAARRFRKQHLTKNDESRISNILESAKITSLVLGFFFFAFTMFIPSPGERSEIGIRLVLFITFVACPIAASIFARRVTGQNGIIAALLWDMAAKTVQGLFFITFLPMLDWPPRPLFWITCLGISLNPFFLATDNYRLWKKFAREQKRRGEMVEIG